MSDKLIMKEPESVQLIDNALSYLEDKSLPKEVLERIHSTAAAVKTELYREFVAQEEAHSARHEYIDQIFRMCRVHLPETFQGYCLMAESQPCMFDPLNGMEPLPNAEQKPVLELEIPGLMPIAIRFKGTVGHFKIDRFLVVDPDVAFLTDDNSQLRRVVLRKPDNWFAPDHVKVQYFTDLDDALFCAAISHQEFLKIDRKDFGYTHDSDDKPAYDPNDPLDRIAYWTEQISHVLGHRFF